MMSIFVLFGNQTLFYEMGFVQTPKNSVYWNQNILSSLYSHLFMYMSNGNSITVTWYYKLLFIINSKILNYTNVTFIFLISLILSNVTVVSPWTVNRRIYRYFIHSSLDVFLFHHCWIILNKFSSTLHSGLNKKGCLSPILYVYTHIQKIVKFIG